jgi:hypothetical protein
MSFSVSKTHSVATDGKTHTQNAHLKRKSNRPLCPSLQNGSIFATILCLFLMIIAGSRLELLRVARRPLKKPAFDLSLHALQQQN